MPASARARRSPCTMSPQIDRGRFAGRRRASPVVSGEAIPNRCRRVLLLDSTPKCRSMIVGFRAHCLFLFQLAIESFVELSGQKPLSCVLPEGGVPNAGHVSCHSSSNGCLSSLTVHESQANIFQCRRIDLMRSQSINRKTATQYRGGERPFRSTESRRLVRPDGCGLPLLTQRRWLLAISLPGSSRFRESAVRQSVAFASGSIQIEGNPPIKHCRFFFAFVPGPKRKRV